jgi:hypothetical protein
MQTLLHDTIQFAALQKAFKRVADAEQQASCVYHRVLERYPSNGRLLKIFGRFLEYVKVGLCWAALPLSGGPWVAACYSCHE